MVEPTPERRWKKDIVRTFRFNRDLLASMEAECRVRHVSLSEYVRQASVAFMRLRSRIALRFGKATTDLPPQGCTRRIAEPSAAAASAVSAAVTGSNLGCKTSSDLEIDRGLFTPIARDLVLDGLSFAQRVEAGPLNG